MLKVCLVIGGTGDLGAACAKDLAVDHKIIIAGRNAQKGDSIVQAIKSTGGEATFLPFDICSPASITKLHKAVTTTYGRLDAAINGAGILGPFGKLTALSPEEVTHLLATNLTGVITCLQAQIRAMQANPSDSGGRIVTFSSLYGAHGCKFGGVGIFESGG